MREKPPQPIVYPKIVQVPTSPPAPRNHVAMLREPEKPQNVVDLWFQLFSGIMGNDQLTEKAQFTIPIFRERRTPRGKNKG